MPHISFISCWPIKRSVVCEELRHCQYSSIQHQDFSTMTSPTFVFILTCLVLNNIAQTVALKSASSVHHKELEAGESLTLKCDFNNKQTTFKYYWYKQILGEDLQLISSYFKYDEKRFHSKFKDDPRFTLDAHDGTNHLNITDLQLSDSATYHCIVCRSYEIKILKTIAVSVKGSGLSVPALVHQSESETIQPGGSVTLNCTVRTGTYDCTVVSCGHILFGDGTKLDFEDEVSSGVLVYSLSGALISAVILIVVLAFLLYKMNKRICFLSQEIQARFSAPSTTNMEGNRGADDVCYAALNVNMPNTSRRQRNTARDECVYSSVRQ
ncbi:uncharacterized protein LOC121505045 [Cheilinus undulatus]|uniref:uncharacterized protein LOC121505045 n=1 Tax=Cheilinus undulatus TaxID=241271 RepID=UPI001BD397D6|nr:uncharacterized protein LOC121505045 [Cheilinus undulatus]